MWRYGGYSTSAISIALSGDSGLALLGSSDGVPNFLSRDDVISEGVRQTPLRKQVVETYLKIDIDKEDKYYRNYLRNQTLIDLECIPQEIEVQILQEFSSITVPSGKVYDYLRKHQLNELMNNVKDFRL